ncbi:hypothetical protein MBGDN05_00668 [Thermoplasmatales archaeon SCGC AB-539-N05]|nr:hypothetical protein MBGDN05_00668 [Thermoplasmatales archaeon SCGC AB-539-N05]
MISVLRVGHRRDRDKRVTTHVALVARAFGAEKVLVDAKDEKLKDTLQSVSRRFGGTFEIETGINWRNKLKEWKGVSVHLTMYGESLEKVIDEIPRDKDLLIVIGAEKVPADVYQMANYNVSVGNQPHSEIAALSVFLDRFTKGKWLQKNFDGNIQIVPAKVGKKVITKNEKDK